MDSINITLIIIVCIICISTIIGFIMYIKSMKEIKNKELDIKRFELYKNISPNDTEKLVDDYISNKLNKYATTKIIAKGIDYIKEEEADKMVKDISSDVIISMSDLYIFYIKLLANISNEDDLIKYIYDKVSDACILFIMDFNTPK